MTQDNSGDWDRLLAAEVNGWYDTFHNGNVFIGRWHPEMNHYMYFRNDLYGNYFNSKDARASGVFSITPANGPNEPDISIVANKVVPLEGNQVTHGDIVLLQGAVEGELIGSLVWEQSAGDLVDTEQASDNVLIVNTASLSEGEHSLAFTLRDSGSDNQTIYRLTLVSGGLLYPHHRLLHLRANLLGIQKPCI